MHCMKFLTYLLPLSSARPIAVLLILLIMLAGAGSLRAQDTVLTGFVLELDSGEPLPHVDIKNLKTGVRAKSGQNGQFSIRVDKNGRLEFDYPGYRTDTLVVIEFEIKRVYLTPDGSNIRLDEVQIQAMTDSRLATEIKRAEAEGQFSESSQHRGGVRISPSRWFGSQGRQARLRYKLLLAEQERRKIDSRFTPQAIMAVTPLLGEDLELFMTRYRPTVEFLSTADEAGLRLYIMDSYALFKELTPEERAEIKAPKRDAP